jgi:hypothetical protein
MNPTDIIGGLLAGGIGRNRIRFSGHQGTDLPWVAIVALIVGL